MVNNTEMIGPLNNIQIIGTVRDIDKKMDIKRTYVRVIDHFWKTLEDKILWDFHRQNTEIILTKRQIYITTYKIKKLEKYFRKQDTSWFDTWWYISSQKITCQKAQLLLAYDV